MTRIPTHLIAAISYSKDTLSCACGWSGKARDGVDWSEHRRAMGVTSQKHRGEGIKALRVVPGWEGR